MRVLIICEGKITRLGRVRRTIELLQEMQAEISSLSDEPSNDYAFAMQLLLPKMSASLFARIYRFSLKILRKLIPVFSIQVALTRKITGFTMGIIPYGQNWDLIIIEHIDFLPLACELKVKQKAKLFFDIRDFYPREFEKYFMFRLLEAGYRKAVFTHLLRECDAVATVSYGLVDALKQEYGIEAYLIRSMPTYENKPVVLVDKNIIRIVHHGSANADRLLGETIKLFEKLDKRFTLDLYLVGNSDDILKLKQMAGNNPAISFHEPVAFDHLIGTLNQYDIGIFFWEPTTFNIKYCLPNKLFEFIQARLMIISTPLPDISRLVIQHKCGLILPSFDINESVKVINSLTVSEVMEAKKASDVAAKKMCFQEEKNILRSVLNSIINKHPILDGMISLN